MPRRRSPRPKTPPEDDRRPDSDVWLGDVVRAWTTLGAETPEARALIAEILGFDYAFTGKERRKKPRPEGAAAAAGSANVVVGGQQQETEQPARSDAAVALPLARTREPSAQAVVMPDWLHVDHALEPELPQHLAVRLPHQPLFRAGWTRAILSAACATTSHDGPIDMTRVIDALANCRPLTGLPRESILSLRRGMQLLLDRGENLMPVARDVRDLQQQLLSVVGRDRSRVLHFDGCPTLGCGPGARSTWRKPYKPPASETPIVVLTDFGMARGGASRSSATEDDWLKFLEIARASGCPVIVFAPYPLSRWPSRLVKSVRPIPWDQRTTVSLASQTARAGDHG